MDEPAPLVLTIDDDPHLLALIENKVSGWGYDHRGATDTEQMYKLLEKISPSVILLDVALGKTDGTTLLPQLKQQLENVPIIMITANATIETAVKSLKSGAYDFVCKPLDFDRLHIEIDKAVRQNRLSLQVRAFQSAARRTDFHGMIGRSEPMRKAYRLIEAVAPTDATVLLLGQTGTGKELAARAIHECSNRRDGPFVAVNAPAIPNELIESALFGHEKGAFTGAHQQHIGYCEQADGGTLFLDEICEMNYEVQAKLLRFLQDHVVQRVGSKTTQKVNVRVIAATNRDPAAQIRDRKLREDFYYRLSVVSINLSPLNQRADDVLLLARYFLDLAAAKYGKEMATFAGDVPGLLENYSWPGNVRQLEHLIDQVVITNGGTELVSEMLPEELQKPVIAKPVAVEIDSGAVDGVLSIRKMEEQMILQSLELASGSVRGAAKYLELSEATLYRKIKRLGIKRSFEKGAE